MADDADNQDPPADLLRDFTPEESKRLSEPGHPIARKPGTRWAIAQVGHAEWWVLRYESVEDPMFRPAERFRQEIILHNPTPPVLAGEIPHVPADVALWLATEVLGKRPAP
jgi:hypothetical protein